MQGLAALARAAEDIALLVDKVSCSLQLAIVVSEPLLLVQGALKG